MTLKSLSFGLLGAAALMTAATAANAADVYDKGGSLKDGPADYIAPVAWTGFYVGANVGAAFDNSDDSDDEDTFFAAGGHLGFNWQGPSNVVLGLEGDLGFLNADDVDYLATIRGRLGYAAGPALLYATGGVAFIGLDEENFTGYVVGGGLDYKIKENWTAGVEGLYYDFTEDGDDDDATFFTARARLTYHFGHRYDALK
jgi:outer membrane immunogenic protein